MRLSFLHEARRSKVPPMELLEPFICDEQCFDIAQGMAYRVPELRRYRMEYEHGVFYGYRYRDCGYCKGRCNIYGHGWCVLPDGTVIDVTHGQFKKKTPIAIIPPDHPDRWRWKNYEQFDSMKEVTHIFGDDTETLEGWGHLQESRETFQPGPCLVCGDQVRSYEDASGLHDAHGRVVHGRCALQQEQEKRRAAELAKMRQDMMRRLGGEG